jgi:eukaryotic-like serine/threonine-protein kinase
MPLPAGARLGPYEVLSPLGAGGMGEVYRARDTRLDREVAIKVLPERLAEDPAALSRFEREAKALAALSHPNVLTILDFGQQDGIAYAVTELLEGETLRGRLLRAQMSWREAAELGLALADGLAAAHSRGIVHRDLKPENVFLTSDGRAKILDFGLARREALTVPPEETRQKTETQMTEPGAVMGTVGYMSPEQVSGASADARSDIFSLGCVLYEMVTGSRPFSGRTGAETLAAILHMEPADPVHSGRELPADFAGVIRHCLEKKPDQRFQSARDLAFALKAILAGAPATAPALVPVSRLRKRVAVVAAVAVVVLLGSLVFVVRRGLPGRAATIRSVAVLPLQNLSNDAGQDYFVDGMTEELIANLAKVENLRVISRTSIMQYKGVKKPLPQIARELGVESVVEGSVSRSGQRIRITVRLMDGASERHLWAESYERDLTDVLAVQAEASRAIVGEIKVRLTPEEGKRLVRRRSVDPDVYDAYLKGRYHQYKFTPEGFERSLEFFRTAIEKDPTYASAYAGIASTYAYMAYEGVLPPRECVAKLESAAMRALQLDDSLGEVHYALAELRREKWDRRGAAEEFKKAISLSPQDSLIRRFHALDLRSEGRWEEAIAEGRRAQELDPLSPETTKALGATYFWAGRYDESIRQFQGALEIDPNFAPAHDLLADAYARKGMYREAIAAERKYLSLVGDDESAAELERDFTALGYPKAMRSLYRKSLALTREAAKSTYVSPVQFVILHAYLGERDEAFVWLERAFKERDPRLGFLKTDPQFEPLRSDPRFAELVRRIEEVGARAS